MTRHTRDGKRIVNRKPRYEVPAELLRDLDVQAVKVMSLRKDMDDLAYKVRWYDHEAYKAGFRADTATSPGLRKAEYDRADRLKAKANSARNRLSRTERTLADHEQALGEFHRTARQYQRGEHEDEGE